MSKINMGTLYDYNKELSSKEKILDPIIRSRKILEMAKSLYCSNKYLMLLCHEQRDYTVFNIHETSIPETLAKELSETLFNRGQIVSIDKTEDNQAWEIWIRIDDNEDFCYYLFGYTSGIVEVE